MIRPAIPADITQLSVLKQPKDEEHRQVYEKVACERMEQSKTQNCLLLVVENHDKILGQVFLRLDGNETEPDYPNIQDLFIAQEQRSKGLGRQLIQECESIARKKGYTKISVAVNPTLNYRAQVLYESLGYVSLGKKPYLDGVYDGDEDWVIDLVKELK